MSSGASALLSGERLCRRLITNPHIPGLPNTILHGILPTRSTAHRTGYGSFRPVDQVGIHPPIRILIGHGIASHTRHLDLLKRYAFPFLSLDQILPSSDKTHSCHQERQHDSRAYIRAVMEPAQRIVYLAGSQWFLCRARRNYFLPGDISSVREPTSTRPVFPVR